MASSNRRTIALIALCILLAASLAGNVILYPLATRPLYQEGDRPLIERTMAAAAARSPSQAGDVFPIVVRLAGTTCVELRRADARGNFGVCYDRNGRAGREFEGVVN